MSRFTILFILIFICRMPFGLAQHHSVQQDSIKTLKLIEVIGKQVAPAITPVQKIDREAIHQFNQNSVADAIRYFSGVQLKDYGGIGGLKTVNIRSMGSEQIGVFYNGVQLGNAQNGQIDLGRFSMDNMEAIALYNGQKVDLLQAAKDYSTASAIYLKTIKPALTEEDRRLIKLNFKTGSFGVINPAVLWQERWNAKLQTNFSAEATKAHGRYPFTYKVDQTGGALAYDTSAIRQNGDVAGLRIETAVYGDIPNGTWELQAYSYFSERGLPGFIGNNRFKHEQRQWDENLFLQGSLNKRISPLYSFQIKAKAARDYTRYLDNSVNSIQLDNNYTQNELYFSLANEFQLNKYWNWGLATDYQYNQLHSNLIGFLQPKRQTVLTALTTSYRRENLQISSSLLANYITEFTVTNNRTKRFHNYTPTLAISAKPFSNKAVTLSAFYKKSYRAPTINEMYYTLQGVSLLEPELTTQYNASIQYIRKFSGSYFKQLTIQSNVYYNSVRNKIVALSSTNEFRSMFLNLGKVNIKGGDISVATEWLIMEALQVKTQINYTYQNAIDVSNPDNNFYKKQIPYTPWHSGTCIIQAGYHDWFLTYCYIYTGERYSRSENIIVNYLTPWYTSDVSISKKLMIRKLPYKIGLELNNVMNQQYDVIKNYPMPGRNFKISCSVTL